MLKWCHTPTGFRFWSVLQFVALVFAIVALSTTVFFARPSAAAPATNKTLTFQGRLLTSAGAVVPDGNYNMQFKIYQDGAGNAAGNPGGTLEWTETHANNGTATGIEVRNGFFAVNLGSITSFGSSVDWDAETLWLSMNVAGTATSCATFGSAPCPADGEMLPMKRITATPYALNAGAVNGKTADNFIQLAQGVQNDASANSNSIHINKTGAGNFLQLQNTGSNVLSITNSGNIEFGNSDHHAIYVGNSPPETTGKNLTIFAGYGGSGEGSMGGALFLQGGSAGGDNGEGGSVAITGGVGTGTGKNGSVYIGASDTDTVQIGSSNLASGTQTLNIGNSSGAGTTNVTIGSTGAAGGGTTTIQSKDDTIIATNGEQRARFSGNGNTLYVGNADTSGNTTTANGFTIQGTSSTGANTQGGGLTLQAGAATNGNANGGTLTLSGGSGSGTGATGLVVINTPTFQTAANDTNCYTGGTLVASSCTFTSASVNGSSVLVAGFSADSQVATLPDPSITTAGRIMYVTAASGSKQFSLRLNTGGGAGVEQNVTMQQNTTTTLVWNGTDWTIAGSGGAPSPTTLQDAYNNTSQAVGSADIVLDNRTSDGGLTVRDSSTDSINGPLLTVQSASAATLFSVNSNVNELAVNPGAETAGGDASSFPANNWVAAGSTTVSRHATPGNYIATGQGSVKVVSTGPVSGAANFLKSALTPNKRYNVSASVRLESGTYTDFGINYSADGVNPTLDCITDQTVTSTAWARITCSFLAPSSGITSNNIIAVGQTGSTPRTFYIDNLSVTPSSDAGTGSVTPNVQIGGGNTGGAPTLFTLDKNASAPDGANHDALLGSMYYDTSLGKVQCYESEGWGNCGDNPDTFITLSPEYSNAVMHGSGDGTISSGLCSDSLNINDGSSAQPTICGTNETQNFYQWTTTEATDQTRSIFVTQQLPTNFKDFVADSTSLLARTDSTNATVSYQVYRNNSSGLTACGSPITVSTGVKTSWQKVAASGSADPANCSFEAGDSIVIRINLTSNTNANAYVSNLNFTYSTN